MKNCCYVYRLMRWAKWDVPLVRFTCPTCGQSYVWKDWTWEEVSTVDEIKDMMAHQGQEKD